MTRILIVDDKEENIYYLQALLEANGWEVETARHGAEALVKARQRPPDLVISDLLMPVMDGYTLLRLWKADAILKKSSFIVYTATYTEPEDERLALSLGADAFILKPTEPDAFLARLREVQENAAATFPDSPKTPVGDEKELLKVYSETLIRKLEEKTLQLEESNRALQQDIASRKKAEDALRLLNSAVLQTKESILITDANLDLPGPKILFVNPAFTEMTGYTSEEAIGKTPRILQGPRTDKAVLRRLRKNLEGGAIFEGEAINYRKDGTEYIQEWQVAPLRDDQGSVTHYVAIQRDITSRKKAEDELRWKTAFLEAQVNSSLDGILVVDNEGRKIIQNQRMSDLWKIPPDIVGDDDNSVQVNFVTERTKNPAEFSAKVAHLYSHPNEVSRDEIELVDGTILDRFTAPVKDEDGKYYGRIWAFRDITLERNREVMLAEALAHEMELSEKARAGERAKSEFLAVMSHEIRTPLHGIIGFSELLTRAPELLPESRDHVKTIASSGEALLRILDDVLDFSRLEAGRLQIETHRFAPREILGDVRTLLARQAGDKGLDLVLSIAADTPEHLEGDAGRLRQILLNLTGNAIKFTERGSITLGLRRGPVAGNYAYFVKDTGPGITPEQVERIFQPFTQADSSISRRYGGAGLGLSISRRLAELMGGTLEVRSQLGQGAEFVVTVPLVESSTVVKPTADAQAIILDADFASRHPLRVLVVEDDKVNLKLILILMRRLGYEPLSATNGREAVELQRREHPDCILMDLQMPEMDGIEATQKIRAEERASPGDNPAFISALTANIFPADRQRCLDAGMNGYLNKPVRLADLAGILEQATDFKASRSHHAGSGQPAPAQGSPARP